MDSQSVIVERTFNVDVAEMWQALTDNEKLKQWYFVLPEFRAEIGFKFTFMGGTEENPQYVHLCEVIDVEEEKKLAYTWRYEGYPGNSIVTIELFPEGDSTKLRLTHSGLETIAPAGPDFSIENFKGGWSYFVNEALAGYFGKQSQN